MLTYEPSDGSYIMINQENNTPLNGVIPFGQLHKSFNCQFHLYQWFIKHDVLIYLSS